MLISRTQLNINASVVKVNHACVTRKLLRVCLLPPFPFALISHKPKAKLYTPSKQINICIDHCAALPLCTAIRSIGKSPRPSQLSVDVYPTTATMYSHTIMMAHNSSHTRLQTLNSNESRLFPISLSLSSLSLALVKDLLSLSLPPALVKRSERLHHRGHSPLSRASA